MTPSRRDSLVRDLAGPHGGRCGPGDWRESFCRCCRAASTVRGLIRRDPETAEEVLARFEAVYPQSQPATSAPSSPPSGVASQLRAELDRELRANRASRRAESTRSRLEQALCAAPLDEVDSFRDATVLASLQGWPDGAVTLRQAYAALLKSAKGRDCAPARQHPEVAALSGQNRIAIRVINLSRHGAAEAFPLCDDPFESKPQVDGLGWVDY